MHPGKTAPGNERKETDIGASAPRGLVNRDYAPAPRNEHCRQGYLPRASFVGGGSNSLLSPPARLISRVRGVVLSVAARSSPPRQKRDTQLLAQPKLSRGNKRTQGFESIDSRRTWVLRHSEDQMSMCVLRRIEAPARLLEIDGQRPGTGAADSQPLQPTQRVLRFWFHWAFSYAEDTLPQVPCEKQAIQKIFFRKISARVSCFFLRNLSARVVCAGQTSHDLRWRHGECVRFSASGKGGLQ